VWIFFYKLKNNITRKQYYQFFKDADGCSTEEWLAWLSERLKHLDRTKYTSMYLITDDNRDPVKLYIYFHILSSVFIIIWL